MLRIILEETYVRFSGYIFKQIQGVPMDGNASPDIADLTLSVMEYRFLRKNLGFHFHLFRYIDDILVVNCANFAEIASNIYGPNLQLNTTYSGQHACFLDLQILCQNGRCILAYTIRPWTTYSQLITVIILIAIWTLQYKMALLYRNYSDMCALLPFQKGFLTGLDAS
ncbi:unnamed protein product [Gongylonema pulchrum]|uniref:Reverse transcriptase domain-containing protein n=1 Tax=Gongylonema pulchrum TaxID=637853 RepID=A0A183EA32_9BILA|nr:unnamed protein product [Gongylonema pulchrum]